MPDSSAANVLGEQLPPKPQKKVRRPKSKSLVIFVLIILLVGGSLTAAYLLNKDDTEVIATDPCTGSILDRSVALLAPIDYTKVAELNSLATEIVAKDGYEKYPNCLYPVVQSYILTGNYEAAAKTFAAFESAYGDGSSFETARFVTNIDVLRKQVDGLKAQVEQIKKGSGVSSFGPPNSEPVGQGEQ